MPHVGLVGLHIERLSTGLLNGLPEVQVMVLQPLDPCDVLAGITGGLEFIGDVGISSYERCGPLVKRRALRLSLAEVGRDLGIAAEVMDVLQFPLGWLDRLDQQRQLLDGLVESLLALGQSVLDHDLGIGPQIAVVDLGSVDGDRLLDLFE